MTTHDRMQYLQPNSAPNGTYRSSPDCSRWLGSARSVAPGYSASRHSKAGRRVREQRDGPDHDLLHLGVTMPQPTDQRTQIHVALSMAMQRQVEADLAAEL